MIQFPKTWGSLLWVCIAPWNRSRVGKLVSSLLFKRNLFRVIHHFDWRTATLTGKHFHFATVENALRSDGAEGGGGARALLMT